MSAAAPTGTLIQKMVCHPAQVVRAPPTATPAAMPRPADGAPQGESAGALGAGVGGHDDGQRGGGHQRGSGSLDGAAGDEFTGGGGEPAEQGRGGEQSEAGHEHAPAWQEVGDAATQQQPAAGEQQIGGDHPLQVAAGEPQVLADGRHGGVDDRDVEDDERLGG